jgi:hypothetical protein
MRFQFAAAILVSTLLAAFGPYGSANSAVGGQAYGSATYHTVSGQHAELQMTFGNFSGDVPDLVLTFTSADNWIAEHQPVNVAFSNCQVAVQQLECGPVSAHKFLNLDLIGSAAVPGHFEYTIAFWSVTSGHRTAITASDARSLTVSWIEEVAAY